MFVCNPPTKVSVPNPAAHVRMSSSYKGLCAHPCSLCSYVILLQRSLCRTLQPMFVCHTLTKISVPTSAANVRMSSSYKGLCAHPCSLCSYVILPQRSPCPPLQPKASVGVTVMSTQVLVSTQFSCREEGGHGDRQTALSACLDACQPGLMVMTA
jgi:hypothetical protein